MDAHLVAESTIKVGKSVAIEGPSPSQPFVVVFEDDGETGYAYALDTREKTNPIVDALLIYEVKQVKDRRRPSKLQIAWSLDGLKSVVLINDYPHAIFDFDACRGFCRLGFPPPSDKTWPQESHEWDDKALDLFR